MPMTAHDLVVAAKARIREITVTQARAMIAAGTTVIDVREPEEYAAGHLPGAINLPRGLLEFKVAAEPEMADRNRAVLVYCKTSGRAALATVVLHLMGWELAVSVAGGYDLWAAEDLPIERPAALDFE